MEPLWDIPHPHYRDEGHPIMAVARPNTHVSTDGAAQLPVEHCPAQLPAPTRRVPAGALPAGTHSRKVAPLD